MAPLTADTITDKQIREMQATLTTADDDWWTCYLALHGGRWAPPSPRHDARVRCAEILTARAAGKEGA